MAKSESMLLFLFFMLLWELTTFLQIHAQDICGSIGNRNENRVTERRDKMFYLNTANPAPCTGNITSWRVCYYGPSSISIFSLRNYRATYAVYRRTGSGSTERYEKVSEMFNALRATRLLTKLDRRSPNQKIDGVIQSGFNCYTDNIDTGDSPLTVQSGDVFGACVFDPVDQRTINRRQLDIVGEISGESLQAMAAGGCSLTEIPSSIPVNQLSNVNSRRLHLYADIAALSPPAITTTTSTTNVANTSPEKIISSTTSDRITTLSTKISSTDSSASTQSMSSSTSGHSTTPQTKDKKPNVTAIAAGSTVGTLVLLITLVVIIIIAIFATHKKFKRQSFALTVNSAYTRRSTEELSQHCSCEVITKENAAYKSSYSSGAPAVARKNEEMLSHEYQDRPKEIYPSNGKTDSSVNMKKNVAYQSHTTLNVAYESQKSSTSVKSDNYDYVN